MRWAAAERPWRSAACTALLLLSGCDSELVTLGRLPTSGPTAEPSAREPTLVFGAPQHRAELGSVEKDDNATLTGDALQVYFTSTRDENADVYRAVRRTRDEPFGAPEPFGPANTDEAESSPAIALDGNTLWVGQERDEGLGEIDIWVTTKNLADGTWSPLQNVLALNSSDKDIPRPAAGKNLVMPLGSQRAGLGDYRTYLATRPSETEEFGTPVLLAELEMGARVVDGFLSEDLKTMFFSSGDGEDEGDLFYVQRSSASEPFGAPLRIDTLNSDADERDPWLSPDSTRFFFTSDRLAEGDHEIYEVVVTTE